MVFDELGLDRVEVKINPGRGKLPDGSYIGYISNARIITKRKDNNRALILTYKVEDESSEFNEQEMDEWRTFPTFVEEDGYNRFKDEAAERNARLLKQRLLTLGVKEDEIPSIDLSDLVGTPVMFVVKEKDGYKNIRYVETRTTIGTETGLKDLI